MKMFPNTIIPWDLWGIGPGSLSTLKSVGAGSPVQNGIEQHKQAALHIGVPE